MRWIIPGDCRNRWLYTSNNEDFFAFWPSVVWQSWHSSHLWRGHSPKLAALLKGKLLSGSSRPQLGRWLDGNPTLPFLLLTKRRSALCFVLRKGRISLHISFKSCSSKDNRLTVGHQRSSMGTMIRLERPSWRDWGQNRHILEVLLLLLRAVSNIVQIHRDWLQIGQHYREPV